MTSSTVESFKKENIPLLKKVSQSPALDLDILLMHVLKINKTQLLLNRNKELSKEDLDFLSSAVKKRSTGLPIAYITGEKEFYAYNFYVNENVLIPKPDTEILVEMACQFISEKINRTSQILSICDMCTGSGCIAISVAKSLLENYSIPKEKFPVFYLADISSKALEVCKINISRLIPKDLQSNLRIIQSNLFQNIPFKFDFILTNPPYIPHSMVDNLLLDGRNEPRLALDGDVNLYGDFSNTQDGLTIIRNLLPQAKEHLIYLGRIIMETGEYNAQEAEKIASELGFNTQLYKDLEGQLRGFYTL